MTYGLDEDEIEDLDVEDLPERGTGLGRGSARKRSGRGNPLSDKERLERHKELLRKKKRSSDLRSVEGKTEVNPMKGSDIMKAMKKDLEGLDREKTKAQLSSKEILSQKTGNKKLKVNPKDNLLKNMKKDSDSLLEKLGF